MTQQIYRGRCPQNIMCLTWRQAELIRIVLSMIRMPSL